MSRLSANLPLIKYNLCPLSFIDVPHKAYIEGLIGGYELNRVDPARRVPVGLRAFDASVQGGA